jgi:chromate transport protein ChrA
VVDGALFGIKAAVLVIVVEALIRIGKRALKTRCCSALPGAAFVGIFFFNAAVSADRRDGRADRLSGGAQSRPAMSD